MTCPPCNVGDHDNCTVWTSVASLGMRDQCSCNRYAEVHFVWAKVALPARSNCSDEEIRDRQHDTGEDEFYTWIARNMEDD